MNKQCADAWKKKKDAKKKKSGRKSHDRLAKEKRRSHQRQHGLSEESSSTPSLVSSDSDGGYESRTHPLDYLSDVEPHAGSVTEG